MAPESGQLALLNSMMLLAAFLGAFVFGRFADVAGRKRVYWMVAAIMVVAALGSALSPSFWVLIVFRFVLGFGVGGDYPVSAVMMSEYANRKDRGKLVGMVFGTQALGLIVGSAGRAGPARRGRQQRCGVAGAARRWARCPPPQCSTCAGRCRNRRATRCRCKDARNRRRARSLSFTGGQVSGDAAGRRRGRDGVAGLPD